MHRLLARQLKRHIKEIDQHSEDRHLAQTPDQNSENSLEDTLVKAGLPEDWIAFLADVNNSYEQADTDRYRLEHIVLQNSQELLALNSRMKAAIPDTFLRLDKQSMILEYKPGNAQQAYLSSSEVIGKPLKRFLPEDACEKFADAIAKLDMQAMPEVSIFHHLISPDSETGENNKYFYEARILPFPDDQVVAIVRDITERKQAEKALRDSQQKLRERTHRLASTLADLKEAQTQLVQTEKMSGLGQLVAGIAHEINNPVNFVSGNIKHIQVYIEDLIDLLELYRESYPTPTKAIQAQVEELDLDFLLEDLNKTQSSMRLGVNRIKEIVLSLRIFSRLDEAEMKAVNIHEGIESTLLILKHRFKQHKNLSTVKLEKHYGELPLVECYAGQLNQVFMNILANALDAIQDMRLPGEPQAPKIEIHTAVMPNNYISIRIVNNGPTIPYEIRDKLFDPFFTTKPIGKGTGLGLSISYQIIVDRHKGRMRCYSLPGQNTEFCVEIPIHQDGHGYL